ADALNAGGAGAKLRFAVAVPNGGEFAPGLAIYVTYTANFNDSFWFGLVLTTSQTADAAPLTTESSVMGTFPTLALDAAPGKAPPVALPSPPASEVTNWAYV